MNGFQTDMAAVIRSLVVVDFDEVVALFNEGS